MHFNQKAKRSTGCGVPIRCHHFSESRVIISASRHSDCIMQLPHSPAAKVHFAIKTLAREPLGDSHACFADTIYNECKISPENEPTVLHIFGNKRGLAR
jgi:hypothetical protein